MQSTVVSDIAQIEATLQSEVLFYVGSIAFDYRSAFLEEVEFLASKKNYNRISVFLNTPGGSAEFAEQMVSCLRTHFEEVYFVVPDFAMSAGTMLCMSGDKIYMDYSSSLGPIDPQVWNGKRWVPALGYLDKVTEFVSKSAKGKLTEAELAMLLALDLADLRMYEQARELAISLLKEWLVKYKFKDWTQHRTTGKAVTQAERQQRAEEIARKLSDNKLWHSHARFINLTTLRDLKLQIDDLSENKPLQESVRNYNRYVMDFIAKHKYNFLLHHKYMDL